MCYSPVARSTVSRDGTPATECQTGVSLGLLLNQRQEGHEVQTHNYTETFHVPSQLARLTNSLLLAMESYLNFALNKL